ncbi:tail spike protein [Vibrio phage D148]
MALTKVTNRMTDGAAVNVRDFGAVGDGVTDDTAAIQAAVDYCVSNSLPLEVPSISRITNTIDVDGTINIEGMGYNTGFFVDGTSSGDAAFRVKGSNSSLRNFRLYGNAAAGLKIQGSSNALVTDMLLENLYFHSTSSTAQLNQVVWIWTASQVAVQNCSFESTGYGVISQYGYQADDVIVNGCTFSNMYGDAVEANSGGPVVSNRWTISNCNYSGNADFPDTSAENRFVGTASVQDVVITGNTVVNAGGDSVVHIEANGEGKCIISNNTFRDCLGSQGNPGWIYLLNSTKDTTISDNIFIYDTDRGAQTGIAVSSGSYLHRAVWSGNTFFDTTGTHSFAAISAKAVNTSSSLVISSNVGEGLAVFIDCNNTRGLLIDGNMCRDCDYGIWNNAGSSGGGIHETSIVNNRIHANTWTLWISYNSNGTGRCSEIICNNNYLDGPTTFRFSDDCQFSNNMLSAASTLSTPGNTNFVSENNQQTGTGLLP